MWQRRAWLVVISLIAAAMTFTVLKPVARAASCDGLSHIGCHDGVDQSGRTPGALYDAAVEGLREARTPSERDLARRAMRDAFDPSMSNPRAVECNNNPGRAGSFAACVAGTGPEPGLTMVIACQQSLDDGRVLVDGSKLPSAANYKVVRYQPRSSEMGWSHGTCEIVFTGRH